ncbi:fimbrial protein [Serratia marcescens]|uniref:fimbrial protein n=1 Tax=Serratia marcescens TaxID=615 RepID=UPI0040360EDE
MKCKVGRYIGRVMVSGGAIPLLVALTFGYAKAAGNNNVRLFGALVSEPCVIPPGKENIELDFGTVIDKYLYLNTRTQGLPFSISLAECDLNLGNTVRMAFVGTENPVLPGLLALNAGSQATGIALGLETYDARPLKLNEMSSKIPLQAGSTLITLRAYVKGEPGAIANQNIGRGQFSATVTFSLEYE